jgi:hypothetical protein
MLHGVPARSWVFPAWHTFKIFSSRGIGVTKTKPWRWLKPGTDVMILKNFAKTFGEKIGVFTQTVASFATFFSSAANPFLVLFFSVSSIPNPRYNINIFTKEKLVITSVYQRMYYYIIIHATKG